jgi:hypothetical protein
VWQHGVCVGINDDNDAPDRYLCDQCNPRPLDVQKAIRHQKQRREAEQNNHKPRRRTSNHKSKPSHQRDPWSLTLPPQSLPPPNNRREKQISPPPKQTGVKRPKAGRTQTSASQVDPVPIPVAQEEVEVVVDAEERDVAIFPIVHEYEPRDRNDFAPLMQQFLEQQLQQLERMSHEGALFFFVS